MSEFKGTIGGVEIKINNEVGLLIGYDNIAICTLWNHETEEIKVANANLIIDAFKVRQQISCELSELLEQNKEMLAMLEKIYYSNDINSTLYYEMIQLIKKVKGNEI